MKRERVEDGSWHNEEEETSEGGCGRREKIPARERVRREAGAGMRGEGERSHRLNWEGTLREGRGRERNSTDRIAFAGCIGRGRGVATDVVRRRKSERGMGA